MSNQYTNFSNNSNSYVYPDFRPCANNEDAFYFEFMPNKFAGINGNYSTPTSLSLSDIVIPTVEWNIETKYINPNSVIYVPGLTKGFSYRTINYLCPSLYISNPSLPYFIEASFDINYINNFVPVKKTIKSSGTYAPEKLSFADKINIDLAAEEINIKATYDKQNILFVGLDEGFPFEISNMKFRYIDASNFGIDPSIIDLNSNYNIPAIKYINGAFKGILTKVIYPPYDKTIDEYNKWCYMFHVPNDLIIFDTSAVIDGVTLEYNIPDYLVNYSYDMSINIPIDLSTKSVRTKFEKEVFNNEIIISVDASACEFRNCQILDSSLSDNCKVKDSYICNSYMTTGTLTNNVTCASAMFTNVTVENASIHETNLYAYNTKFYNSYLLNLHASGCTLTDTNVENIQAENSIINGTNIHSSINASFNKFVIGSAVSFSSISETNMKYCKLNDSSLAGNEFILMECNINNSSIYDTGNRMITYYIKDSILNGRNDLTNAIVCNSSVHNMGSNNRNIISYSLTNDISVNGYQKIKYHYDSSTKYVKNKYNISVETSCDPSTLSATQLLNYINSNNKWFKVGELYSITGAEDRPNTTDMNKIPGFYVYNPHPFPIKLEYIIFN